MGYIELMDFKARWLDSELQRFISPDDIIPDLNNPQSLNRYSYVNNDPVNATDPTGHHCEDEDINGNCPQDPEYYWGPGISDGGADGGKKGGNNHSNLVGNCIQDVGACYMQGWTNFGSAWSICSNSNASAGDRRFACAYDVAWGGAHVDFATGLAVLAQAALLDLATVNSSADTVSIGSNGLYQRAGYTYFQLQNNIYNIVNSIGLGRVLNMAYMANQINQDKAVIVTVAGGEIEDAGPGTQTELQMLADSGKYISSTANWIGATKIFQVSPWQH
ncbi:MAG TPA: RHS repeat-associated core domain-containing protein [Anaerolineales bacterium]|nr:RHS repeat-associated core domain-containing protein [Anaerolineales bacterium]